jgi:hypothetical protein
MNWPLIRAVIYLSAFLAVAVSAAGQSGAPAVPPRPEIRGVVLEPGSNQPVADAEIELSVQTGGPVKLNGGWKLEPGRKGRTDYSGAFRLALDKPGPYRVEAKKPGYNDPGLRTPSYREVTLTEANPAAEVKMYLSQPGRITGLIVNEETGKPVAKLPLKARRVNPSSGALEPFGPDVVTDANGEFQVTGLAPAEYAVEVHSRTPGGEKAAANQAKRVLTSLPPGDEKAGETDWEHTFWPGGHGEDAVLPVAVGSGATVHIGRIPVRKVPYYRVRVRIPEGGCESGEMVSVGEAILNGRGSVTTHGLTEVPCPKELFVTGFSPGSYRLQLSVRGREPGKQATASVPFSIVDQNVEVTAALSLGITIEGALVAEDGTKLPDLAKTRIVLDPVDHNVFSMDEAAPAMPASDGTFRKEGVRLVDQSVRVIGLGTGNYVKAIRYNGATVKDGLVTIQSGALAHQLTIVIDDKPGTITGVVMSGDKPVNAARVMVMKWPQPAVLAPNGMAGARADEAGQFGVAGLVPGEYRAIAVRSADLGGWTEAAMNRALAAAKKIEVGPANTVNVTLEVTEIP